MPIGSAQVAHAENVGHQTGLKGEKNPGTLKTDTKDYTFYSLSDSSSMTEAVDHFLQEMNRQNSTNETLDGLRMTLITPEMVEIETTIAQLLKELETHSESQSHLEGGKKTPESQNRPLAELKNESSTLRQAGQTNHLKNPDHKNTTTQEPQLKKIYSSLFDLAKSKSAQNGEKKESSKQEGMTKQNVLRESEKGLISSSKLLFERPSSEGRRLDREGNGKQDQKSQQEKEENSQNKRNFSGKEKGKKRVGAIQAALSEATQSESPEIPAKEIKGNQASSRNVAAPTAAKSGQIVGSVENIYIRFMALMARILGQAEFEAHELYLKIKDRTDSIDALTLLLSKINSEKGAIDWSNDEEMKKLIERARAIGVDIPKDKYKWSEEEKKMLKENVQMRKDSMEKVTQLERTDMQRYLQEASQCHQARSNVLKLLKEVIDTILANMRP